MVSTEVSKVLTVWELDAVVLRAETTNVAS